MWLKKTENILNILSREEKLKGYVFVGGSALSYYISHRLSEDIDLFCTDKILKQKRIIYVIEKLSNKGHIIKKLHVDDTTIQNDYEIDEVKVTFFSWSLDVLKTKIAPFKGNIKIADFDLLVGMKTYAFGRRVVFRDAYDIYAISKEIGLEEIIKITKALFGGLFNERNFIEQLKDLSYVEEDRIEEYLEPKYDITKKDIENYFINEIDRYMANKIKSLDLTFSS